MAKYGRKASEKLEKPMHERKKGTLKSGNSGKKVKSRRQAIAIGLPQARKESAKVPPKKASSKKSVPITHAALRAFVAARQNLGHVFNS